MPTFTFEAVDSNGRPVKNSIEAGSVDEARAMLKKKKLFPTNISQKRKAASKSPKKGGGGKKAPAPATGGDPERKKVAAMGGVNQGQLTMFTRQLATLIDAGLPVARAFGILEQMIPPGVLRNAIYDLKDDVESGSQISEAMLKHPKVFDTLYTNMIKAGEAGGVLDTILVRLADFMEKSQKLKKQIISALVYPAAVLTVAGAILLLIIMMIVPKFKEMFDGLGAELPGMTLMLMDFADFLTNDWYLVPLIPIGIIATFKIVKSTKAGNYAIDKASLYLPIFGVIIKKSSVSRFCRTLGTLTASGVPILDALAILRNAVGNAVVESAVGDVHASIREGENIADPLKRSGVFDLLAVNMVAVGEETGELDKMLVKVADIYDNDVDTMVSGMMSLLEPFLIIGMGGAVGFIVIALFLPIISIMENIG
ncbi:MAG: type II secretion system F family protein [Planctomycetota bacterium]|jgi:type IV pilus assembly protein PilC